MASYDLLLLAGDGIGPEIMTQTKRVIDWFSKHGEHQFNLTDDLVGGAAYDVYQSPATDEMMEKAQAADAILFGAVGGEKWADVPYEGRPEAGLLRLRKDSRAVRQSAPCRLLSSAGTGIFFKA